MKWIKVNDLLSNKYSVNKNTRFKTSILRSDLCKYRDVYIVVKGRITVEGDHDAKTRNKLLLFKNNAPFISCISKSITNLQAMQKIFYENIVI